MQLLEAPHTGFVPPQLVDIVNSHVPLVALFQRLGDPIPKHISGEGFSAGTGSKKHGIYILDPGRKLDRSLPADKRFHHDLYFSAKYLARVVIVGECNRRVLDCDALCITDKAKGMGLDIKTYRVVGFGRSKFGIHGPVVETHDAPTPCIPFADVVEWFRVGDAQ